MKHGIVLGAGIGGLTTALALAQKGISVTVYEQAPVLNDVGAGIWVAPNGLKVLQTLGLAHNVLANGQLLRSIRVVDTTNRPISVIDGDWVQQQHGFTTVAIHRAALQRILAAPLLSSGIVLGKRWRQYTQTKEGVTVYFEDGTEQTADFAIIADGIHSVGRRHIQPPSSLRYSGQTCWRFVTDYVLPAGEEHTMYEIWANDKGKRVGYSQINDRQVYVYITNLEPAGGHDSLTDLKARLLALCAPFPTIVGELIQAVAAHNIIRTDLFDFKPLKRWTDGNVVLLGDAAHATTPNLGQGACQAIEDAYILADELGKNTTDIAQAFSNFEKRRIAKTAFITDTSWRLAQVTNTSGIAKKLLIAMVRLTPQFVNAQQLDKIYSVEGI
jgi:2-polyprenyl-6-methoxyphenol hydroxylase-like FAD-dependent oxidoreductase